MIVVESQESASSQWYRCKFGIPPGYNAAVLVDDKDLNVDLELITREQLSLQVIFLFHYGPLEAASARIAAYDCPATD